MANMRVLVLMATCFAASVAKLVVKQSMTITGYNSVTAPQPQVLRAYQLQIYPTNPASAASFITDLQNVTVTSRRLGGTRQVSFTMNTAAGDQSVADSINISATKIKEVPAQFLGALKGEIDGAGSTPATDIDVRASLPEILNWAPTMCTTTPSASCTGDPDRLCFLDETCVPDGGEGCKAGGFDSCRYCGFAPYEPCPGSTPAPTPQPAPEPAACFPADARVLVAGRGHVAMADLRTGEHVLVQRARDGLLDFEPVIGFLHAYKGDVGHVAVTHEEGIFKATPGHLVLTTDGVYKTVTTLRPGDILQKAVGDGSNVAGSRVSSIRGAPRSGAYAPLTASGTLVVDGIVVSTYASPAKLGLKHSVAHAFHFPVRAYHAMMGMLGTQWASKGVEDVPEFHPYLDFMYNHLSIDSLHELLASGQMITY